MLNSLGYDEQLAGSEMNVAITQPDRQIALEHEEKIVGVVVLVPHVLAFGLDDHDIVPLNIDTVRCCQGSEHWASCASRFTLLIGDHS